MAEDRPASRGGPPAPPPVTADEFRRRLVAVARPGAEMQWPRRQRDRQILLRVCAHGLDPGASYDEKLLNERLRAWLAELGIAAALDHVTARRLLVDAGYLERAADGSAYRARRDPPRAPAFAPEVGGLDPAALLRAAREEAARKRERGDAPPDAGPRGA